MNDNDLQRYIRAGVEGYLENEWDNIIDAVTENIMESIRMGRGEDSRINTR